MANPMQRKNSAWIDDDVDSEEDRPPAKFNRGLCTVESCYCKMFDGEYEICGQCGHHGDLHLA